MEPQLNLNVRCHSNCTKCCPRGCAWFCCCGSKADSSTQTPNDTSSLSAECDQFDKKPEPVKVIELKPYTSDDTWTPTDDSHGEPTTEQDSCVIS